MDPDWNMLDFLQFEMLLSALISPQKSPLSREGMGLTLSLFSRF